MKSLDTIEAFREAVANRSLVLVRDGKYGDRVHRLPCTFATAHTFKMKALVKLGEILDEVEKSIGKLEN